MNAKRPRKGGPKSGPERTCALCRSTDEAAALIRWVRGTDGDVVPDLATRGFGRGAWLHQSPKCLGNIPRALERSFKAQVRTTQAEALGLLLAASTKRVQELLGTARRQRALAVGGTLASEAADMGRAELLLVARDAQAASRLSVVQRMILAGKAHPWGTKDELGRLLGRPEVGVVAVVDRRLAQGLFGAIAMALLAQNLLGLDEAGPAAADMSKMAAEPAALAAPATMSRADGASQVGDEDGLDGD